MKMIGMVFLLLMKPQIDAGQQTTTSKLETETLDLRTVLERISQAERLQLDMPSDVVGSVAAPIENGTLVQTLNALLHPLNLDYVIERDQLHVRKELSIHFKSTDLRTVLTIVSRSLRLELDMPNELNLPLSIQLDRVKISALLSVLLSSSQLEYGFDRGTLVIWRYKRHYPHPICF